MIFKFRAKPFQSKFFTILLHDSHVTDADKKAHWLERYGLPEDVLDTNTDSKYQVLKVNNGKASRDFALVNLTGQYGGDAIFRTLLDFALTHKTSLSLNVQIDLQLLEAQDVAPAAVQAMEMATYDLSLYASAKPNPHPLCQSKAQIVFITDSSSKGLRQLVQETQMIAHYQKKVMDLVNGPSNKVDANFISDWAKQQAKKSDLKVTVFNKARMKRQKLDAVLAVNQGSPAEPAFIVTQYQGNKSKDAKTNGLIGKGITFDTGGLSIKGSNNLHHMKSDMAGAAAVLGTIAAVAALKWPVNLVV